MMIAKTPGPRRECEGAAAAGVATTEGAGTGSLTWPGIGEADSRGSDGVAGSMDSAVGSDMLVLSRFLAPG
jgi:hypothetical protein